MTESDSISLVVLSHGLWGNKGHMNYIKNQLIQRYKNSIYVVRYSDAQNHNSTSYHKKYKKVEYGYQ